MDPKSTYEIVCNGKNFPLKDFQKEALAGWFSGKSVEFFKPQKYAASTRTLIYIARDGETSEIVAKKSTPTQAKELVVSAEKLKFVSPGAFVLLPQNYPLRDYQDVEIRKWQAGDVGEGFLRIENDRLYYVDSKGTRIQLGALFDGPVTSKSLRGGNQVPDCKVYMVDITKLAGKTGIDVKTKDFVGFSDQYSSEPAYQKGDHFLVRPNCEDTMNLKLVKIAAAKLGVNMTTASHARPSYLFMGGNRNFATDPHAPEPFLWTEPLIKERENLYWPAYSALKTSSQTRIMMGFTPTVLEQAPPVLGYLTVFHVPNSFYEKYGDVQISVHNDSSVPSGCKGKDTPSLCGRSGYKKVPVSSFVDAVLISQGAREVGVRPVLSIAIGNNFYKVK